MTKIFIFIAVLLFFINVKGQNSKNDSAAVVEVFVKLTKICSNVDFADEEVSELGMFYKAASLIVYRGSNEQRKWKDVCNYSNEKEKQYIDNICTRINGTINQGAKYQIKKYFTESETEGI